MCSWKEIGLPLPLFAKLLLGVALFLLLGVEARSFGPKRRADGFQNRFFASADVGMA